MFRPILRYEVPGDKKEDRIQETDVLPAKLARRRLLMEVDPCLPNNTYCIITRRYGRTYVHRFNIDSSLYLFGPWNPLRYVAVLITTHWLFDIIVILTIVTNCFLLAMYNMPALAEYIFLSIYILEVIFQSIARGLVVGPHSYLRSPWNVLNFILTVLGVVAIGLQFSQVNSDTLDNLQSLWSLRALKVIAVIPGVDIVANALLLSIAKCVGVAFIMFMFIFTTAIIGKEQYMGIMMHKCVRQPNPFTFDYSFYWQHIKDSNNWLKGVSGSYTLCGNHTGAYGCPEDYVCIGDLGENPDHGYTNFDSFGWAMLSTYRIITLDTWEKLYQQVIDAHGANVFLFFVYVIGIGTFYLVNLMLAVVVSSYEAVLTDSKASYDRDLSWYRESTVFPFRPEKLKPRRLPLNLDGLNDLKIRRRRGALAPKQTDHLEYSKQKLVMMMAIPIEEEKIEEREDTGGGDITEVNKRMLHEADDGKETRLPPRDLTVREAFKSMVEHRIFRIYVIIAIIASTVMLAMEYPGMSAMWLQALQFGEIIVTLMFTVEVLFELVAYGCSYFTYPWNLLDFFIVVVSLVDISTSFAEHLAFVRALRLLRMLKLAESWTMLHKLISILLSTVVSTGKLIIVVFVALYIFAVMGMHLLGSCFKPEDYKPGGLPKSNFSDFPHSLYAVFRIMCGQWVEILWSCMQHDDSLIHICPIVIISFNVIGRFILLNLFVAILLNSFSTDSLKNEKLEKTKWKTFKDIIRTFVASIFGKKVNAVRENGKEEESDSLEECSAEESGAGEYPSEYMARNPIRLLKMRKPLPISWWPKWCPSRVLRFHTYFMMFIGSKYVEFIVMGIIISSSITLCFDDVNLYKNERRLMLFVSLNYIFSVIFIIEMVCKLVAFGHKAYFTDIWKFLDLVLVLLSSVGMFVDSNSLHGMSALRVLRVLRPLRLISKWKGMQVLIKSVFRILPKLVEGMFICAFVWLLFGVVGVQLYSKQLYACFDEAGKRLPADLIPDKKACLLKNYIWKNNFVNFDNIPNSFLALFEVATFQGWPAIMDVVVDSRGVDLQPSPEVRPSAYAFFITFIIIGSFLMINVFVGIVVEQFSIVKMKSELSYIELLMSSAQGDYYRVVKKLVNNKPKKVFERPKYFALQFLYEIATGNTLPRVMLVVLSFNAILLSVEYYREPEDVTEVLHVLNIVLNGIYTLETIIKFLGLGNAYFRDPCNLMDFSIWFCNAIGIFIEEMMKRNITSALALGYLFRLIRGIRVLRVIKRIRAILFALLASIPALFNIATLLFLVCFIYTLVGMCFFIYVKENGAIGSAENFRTFGAGMLLMFRLTTSAGWDSVLAALSISPPDCNPKEEGRGNGNCGDEVLAVLFLVSYIILSHMILVNMYVAVILENYDLAKADSSDILSSDDMEMFYDCWALFDPRGTQFIDVNQLSELLDKLRSPLHIMKPNAITIAILDIPVGYPNDVHCLDVLLALVQYILKDKEGPEGVKTLTMNIRKRFIKRFPKLVNKWMISSTAKLRERELAARLIQSRFRQYREKIKKKGKEPVKVKTAMFDAEENARYDTTVQTEPLKPSVYEKRADLPLKAEEPLFAKETPKKVQLDSGKKVPVVPLDYPRQSQNMADRSYVRSTRTTKEKERDSILLSHSTANSSRREGKPSSDKLQVVSDTQIGSERWQKETNELLFKTSFL